LFSYSNRNCTVTQQILDLIFKLSSSLEKTRSGHVESAPFGLPELLLFVPCCTGSRIWVALNGCRRSASVSVRSCGPAPASLSKMRHQEELICTSSPNSQLHAFYTRNESFSWKERNLVSSTEKIQRYR
jgi:hypothetical protein